MADPSGSILEPKKLTNVECFVSFYYFNIYHYHGTSQVPHMKPFPQSCLVRFVSTKSKVSSTNWPAYHQWEENDGAKFSKITLNPTENFFNQTEVAHTKNNNTQPTPKFERFHWSELRTCQWPIQHQNQPSQIPLHSNDNINNRIKLETAVDM